MDATGDDGFQRSPPDPATWAQLPDDVFARVVAHARRGLQKLDEVHSTPEVKRLRAIPAAKLVRGGGRRRLVAAMADGGPVWLAIRTRLETDPDLLADLAAALGSDDVDVDAAEVASMRRRLEELTREAESARAQRDDLERQRDDVRAQRDRARRERDDLRAQLDGALGREEGRRTRMAHLREQADDLRARVVDLEGHLAVSTDDQRRAVERAGRQSAARQRELERDLTKARRELDEARREARRRGRFAGGDGGSPSTSVTGSTTARGLVTGPSGSGDARSRTGGPGSSTGAGDRVDAVVPGRPSRLPSGVRLDTREGALHLLDAVPTLLVDGYNVSRTHRPDLSLERQRAWLVDGLANLATRRRLDATVVFDAHGDGAGGPAPRRRGVRVVWSHPGITADDELVLAVEAMDPTTPIVVTTDDRELRGRLSALGADLLHTSVLAWLL